MSDTCIPQHDPVNALVTFVLCVHCIVSFIPQHYRIISKGSSEGLSPWYLLLGSTGSAATLFNVVTLQWSTVLCCPVWSLGTCVEATAGIIQLALIWILFTLMQVLPLVKNVLHIIYYPPHLKYVPSSPGPELETMTDETEFRVLGRHPERTYDWKVSMKLCQVLLFTFILMLLITAYVVSAPDSPNNPPGLDLGHSWAFLLGLISSALTLLQYIPQLVHTRNSKRVGALSMWKMGIQLAGVPLIVWSLARRPGTDYTSYLLFLVSGSMQLMLMVMCIAWTVRQRRLGIDSFGNPLKANMEALESQANDTSSDNVTREENDEETPLIPKIRVTPAS